VNWTTSLDQVKKASALLQLLFPSMLADQLGCKVEYDRRSIEENTDMSVLHECIEALEKIGAGALAEQALLKLVRLHLQKYEKHLTEVRKELEPFEQQF